MKRPTIKDIARELKISVGTVYRALNDAGRISHKTKQLVLQKARELNYQPNITARKLALRSKSTLLAVLPENPGFYWDDVRSGLNAISLELSEFGVQIDVLLTDSRISHEQNHDELMKRLAGTRYDGLLLAPLLIARVDDVLEYVREHGIPVAMFNTGLDYKDKLFYYGPDNRLTGALAAEVLAKLMGGRGTVGVVAELRQLDLYHQRVKGFTDMLRSEYPGITLSGRIIQRKGDSQSDAELMDIVKTLDGAYIVDSNSGVLVEVLLNRGARIPVVGHEASPESRLMLTEGYISALICEQKVSQGYYPAKLLFEYIVQGTLPAEPEIYSDLNVVFRQNLHLLDYREYGRGYK